MDELIERRGRVSIGLALVMTALLGVASCTGWPKPTESPSPTRTPEPLVPTATSAGLTSEGATRDAVIRTPSHTRTPPAAADVNDEAKAAADTSLLSATATSVAKEVFVPEGRRRFGAGVAVGSISDYPVEAAGLGIGWYMDWNVRMSPARPAGAAFWQMVRVGEGGYRPEAETIRAVAAANPGSFWIIGNEPDVKWQDNTTPERYAELYHELYHLLKVADPACQVVIGGVAQPTPLRLSYLERTLASYRERYGAEMPVDVWNVHGFILREERGSWGVDIPPGISADTGSLYEIEDHDDLDIFRRQILTFRRWMADHGEREKPLVVSEYGILMPSDYGFDDERVRAFMEGSFAFFLTASDDAVGYRRDANRLVQWWCWYSLAAPQDYYPTGNLFDPTTKALTPLGEAFAAYALP